MGRLGSAPVSGSGKASHPAGEGMLVSQVHRKVAVGALQVLRTSLIARRVHNLANQGCSKQGDAKVAYGHAAGRQAL